MLNWYQYCIFLIFNIYLQPLRHVWRYLHLMKEEHNLNWPPERHLNNLIFVPRYKIHNTKILNFRSKLTFCMQQLRYPRYDVFIEWRNFHERWTHHITRHETFNVWLSYEDLFKTITHATSSIFSLHSLAEAPVDTTRRIAATHNCNKRCL